MKKQFTSILLLAMLFALNTNAQIQKAVTYHDMFKKHPREIYYVNAKTGEMHGKYIEYFEDGTIARQCDYINGKQNGKETVYYNNGSTRGLAAVYNYKMGLKEGLQNEYTQDGYRYVKYPAIVRFYKNGNKQWQKDYWDVDGKPYLNREILYDEYERETMLKGYWANGTQFYQETNNGLNFQRDKSNSFEFEAKNGGKHGYFKSWYGNGQLRELHYYKNGLLDSTYQMWRENGTLMIECIYLSGKRTGVGIENLEDGREFQYVYENDKPIRRKQIFSDGTPTEWVEIK